MSASIIEVEQEMKGETKMKNKLYSTCVTVLALALLLAGNFDRAHGGIQPAAAAGSVGYVTVPAAAFTPQEDYYTYVNQGNRVYLMASTESGRFYAPVYLPDGATLVRLTYYWYDDYDGVDATCQLMATDMGTTDWGTVVISSQVASQGYGGYDSTETTTFPVPTVDNSKYLYYMECLLHTQSAFPNGMTVLRGIRIEYTYPVYLPLATK